MPKIITPKPITITSNEEYENQHGAPRMMRTITATWVRTDLLCMECASEAIFEALDSELDYGGGNRHLCAMCGFEFYGHLGVDASYHTDTTKKLREILLEKQ